MKICSVQAMFASPVEKNVFLYYDVKMWNANIPYCTLWKTMDWGLGYPLSLHTLRVVHVFLAG